MNNFKQSSRNWAILVAIMATGSTVNSLAAAELKGVIPPNNATVEGNRSLGRPLSNNPNTTQFIYSSSQLTGIASGSQIGGFSFRLNGGLSSRPTSDLTWTNYDVTLSPSNLAVGSLSDTFAANIGAGAVTVRSGALTLPALSFLGSTTPNNFGPVIKFSNFYTYTGGDLLFTIRHTGNNGAGINVDAQNSPGLLENKAADGYNATTSTTSTNVSPIVQLVIVPEPSFSLWSGLGLLGVFLLKKKKLTSK